MTAVPLTTRDRDALAVFAHRLVDQRDAAGLVERTLARAGDQYAAGDAPSYTLRPWLLGLMVLEHTRHEPRPSRDLALVAAFTELPEEARAALWHLGVEGESAADAADELGLEPSVVLAQARSGVSELRQNVLAQYPPDGRPSDCRWLHRRELEAPSVPLTKGELYRGEQHACACAWCGEMEDQLALASDDLRKVMAVAALGSLAPLYLATRPQPAVTMAPPVPPAFTGIRRTVAANRRPIIGAGAVASVAAAALGIALINPVTPDAQVFSADGAIVEIRGDGSTAQGSVGGPGDLTGGGAAGGPGTTGGGGDGTGTDTAGDGAGGGPGTPGSPGAPGGPGGPGAPGSPGGPGAPGSPGGPGGPGGGGGGGDGTNDGLLRLDLSLAPLRAVVGVGTEPLLGDDVVANAGTDGIGLSGLINLQIPLLGTTTQSTQQAGTTRTTQSRSAKAPRGRATGSPGRSASAPATTQSQRPSTTRTRTRSTVAVPPKATRPATSRPASPRAKAPAHSKAGGKGTAKKHPSKPAPKKAPAPPTAEEKEPGLVGGLLKGLLG